MICERCGTNEAVLHLTIISDAGSPLQQHFCESCAKVLGISTGPPAPKTPRPPREPE